MSGILYTMAVACSLLVAYAVFGAVKYGDNDGYKFAAYFAGVGVLFCVVARYLS